MRDYLLAAGLLFAANLWPVEPNERQLSYEQRVAAVEERPGDDPLELLVLGDSRAMLVDAPLLCASLGFEPDRCANAASVSGDWVTAIAGADRLARHLKPSTTVVVGISEYWLELEDLDTRLGILPGEAAYADLGLWGVWLEAKVPMSAARARRVQKVRRWAERRARVWFPGIVPFVEEEGADLFTAGLDRSNVELWFGSTSDEGARERREVAARALDLLRTRAPHLVVLYMPNPEVRDRWVDGRYPGRRARFFSSIQELTAERRIPFIDLSQVVREVPYYRDFHHLADENHALITPLVAAELAELEE